MIDAAHDMFKKLAAGDKAAIHPNIRGSVYSIVLRDGGQKEVSQESRLSSKSANSYGQYDVILNEYRTSKTADERNTALRSLGRAKDPELIKRTLTLPLGGEVKEQDIYLPLGGLRTHTDGINALWHWMVDNWETLVERLPPGLSMLGSVVQICTSSFTKQEQKDEVAKFFRERSTKGFDQGLAQSMDSVSAKISWLQRDKSDVEGWLQENGYLCKDSGGKL